MATCAYGAVAFDPVIVAMEFEKAHPVQTLIVVTGDHNWPGLTIGFAGTGYDSAFNLLSKLKSSFYEFALYTQAKI